MKADTYCRPPNRVPIIMRASSGGVSSMYFQAPIPALFTMTEGGPGFSLEFVGFGHYCGSVRSVYSGHSRLTTDRTDLFLNSGQFRFGSCDQMTCQPCRANSMAAASPMPLEAPVTRAMGAVDVDKKSPSERKSAFPSVSKPASRADLDRDTLFRGRSLS